MSDGCKNCYARSMGERFGTKWGPDTERRVFGDHHWDAPLRWNRAAAAAGERRRVFSNSMSDVFDKNAPAGVRERLFALIRATPNLQWLLLTKRIGNVARMLPSDWGAGYPNVWLGISVCNQMEADRDIAKLAEVPALIHWLSMEPLLGNVDVITNGSIQQIDWIVSGGESGLLARPMHPVWAQSLLQQSNALDIPFFFKQWGAWREVVPIEWATEENADGIARPTKRLRIVRPDGTLAPAWSRGDAVMEKVGNKSSGHLLEGQTWNAFPRAAA